MKRRRVIEDEIPEPAAAVVRGSSAVVPPDDDIDVDGDTGSEDEQEEQERQQTADDLMPAPDRKRRAAPPREKRVQRRSSRLSWPLASSETLDRSNASQHQHHCHSSGCDALSFRPGLSDLVIHKKKVAEIVAWFSETIRLAEDPAFPWPSMLFLVGPAGCGKTAVVRAVSDFFRLRCLECNEEWIDSGSHFLDTVAAAIAVRPLQIVQLSAEEAAAASPEPPLHRCRVVVLDGSDRCRAALAAGSSEKLWAKQSRHCLVVFTLLPEDSVPVPPWLSCRFRVSSISMNPIAKSFAAKALRLYLPPHRRSSLLDRWIDMLSEDCNGDLRHGLLQLDFLSRTRGDRASSTLRPRDEFMDTLRAARHVLYLKETLESLCGLPGRVTLFFSRANNYKPTPEVAILQWVFANYAQMSGRWEDIPRSAMAFSEGDVFVGQSFQQPLHLQIGFLLSCLGYMFSNKQIVGHVGLTSLQPPPSRARHVVDPSNRSRDVSPLHRQISFYASISQLGSADGAPAAEAGADLEDPVEPVEAEEGEGEEKALHGQRRPTLWQNPQSSSTAAAARTPSFTEEELLEALGDGQDV